MKFNLAAAAALIALCAAPAARAAEPVQAPAMLITADDIPAQYVVLGQVHASWVPDAIMPSVAPRKMLNSELSDEAAKLGADAVVLVTYSKRTFLDKKPMEAWGKAIKFTAPPPGATQTAQAGAGVQMAGATGAPAPGVVAPRTLPQAGAAPVGAAPAAGVVPQAGGAPGLSHAISPGTVVLTRQDIPYRPYTVLGDVSAEAHQYYVFTEVSPEDMLDEQLRKQAFSMGADAVIKIQYHMGRKMFSTPSTAAGKAIKFTD